jgi:hypothetical protein
LGTKGSGIAKPEELVLTYPQFLSDRANRPQSSRYYLVHTHYRSVTNLLWSSGDGAEGNRRRKKGCWPNHVTRLSPAEIPSASLSPAFLCLQNPLEALQNHTHDSRVSAPPVPSLTSDLNPNSKSKAMEEEGCPPSTSPGPLQPQPLYVCLQSPHPHPVSPRKEKHLLRATEVAQVHESGLPPGLSCLELLRKEPSLLCPLPHCVLSPCPLQSL